MLLRAVIVAYNSTGHRATVRFTGSAPQIVDIPVANNILNTSVTAGRRAVVDAGPFGELNDLVILAVYD